MTDEDSENRPSVLWGKHAACEDSGFADEGQNVFQGEIKMGKDIRTTRIMSNLKPFLLWGIAGILVFGYLISQLPFYHLRKEQNGQASLIVQSQHEALKSVADFAMADFHEKRKGLGEPAGTIEALLANYSSFKIKTINGVTYKVEGEKYTSIPQHNLLTRHDKYDLQVTVHVLYSNIDNMEREYFEVNLHNGVGSVLDQYIFDGQTRMEAPAEALLFAHR